MAAHWNLELLDEYFIVKGRQMTGNYIPFSFDNNVLHLPRALFPTLFLAGSVEPRQPTHSIISPTKNKMAFCLKGTTAPSSRPEQTGKLSFKSSDAKHCFMENLVRHCEAGLFQALTHTVQFTYTYNHLSLGCFFLKKHRDRAILKWYPYSATPVGPLLVTDWTW